MLATHPLLGNLVSAIAIVSLLGTSAQAFSQDADALMSAWRKGRPSELCEVADRSGLPAIVRLLWGTRAEKLAGIALLGAREDAYLVLDRLARFARAADQDTSRAATRSLRKILETMRGDEVERWDLDWEVLTATREALGALCADPVAAAAARSEAALALASTTWIEGEEAAECVDALALAPDDALRMAALEAAVRMPKPPRETLGRLATDVVSGIAEPAQAALYLLAHEPP